MRLEPPDLRASGLQPEVDVLKHRSDCECCCPVEVYNCLRLVLGKNRTYDTVIYKPKECVARDPGFLGQYGHFNQAHDVGVLNDPSPIVSRTPVAPFPSDVFGAGAIGAGDDLGWRLQRFRLDGRVDVVEDFASRRQR